MSEPDSAELLVRHTDLILKNALAAYGYSVRPFILIMFLELVMPDANEKEVSRK